MCGIAGTLGFGDPAVLKAMTDAIAHRGPDGEFFFHDGPVHLGCRRLAILDPAGGVQPMSNEDGSVVAVYNGEIYNFPELRRELVDRGHSLHTRCDTELLPHLYEDEGIGFARRLNGIFAFALWDRKRRRLFLVRDPLGVKPLVYSLRDGLLAFGSEAKAVLASGLITPALDEASLHLTMNLRYIPGSGTLFEGIRRLPPGHMLEVGEGVTHRLVEYASIDWTPDTALSEAEWLEGIRAQLDQAVRRQLLSDVPVGVSLSGGIDSSTVLAMFRRQTSGRIQTFTLGFDEPWDETGDARFVAEHFASEHHEIVLREPALKHYKPAILFTEEPKVNCLQLYLLHQLVGRHVKVVLSGLGGDELFGGYDFYSYLRRAVRLGRVLPRAGVRRALRPAAHRLAGRISALERPGLDLLAREVEWLGSLDHPSRLYLLLRNAWDSNQALLERVYTSDFLERLRARTSDQFEGLFDGPPTLLGDALRAESRTKLPNDLLHNEDTMSMAHSVESRVPLLDLAFVRFAARIPHSLRFRYGPKGLLKKALAPILPARCLGKPKWGFTVDPVEQYRKDLRPLAAQVLTPERLRRDGIFNPRFVAAILNAPSSKRLRWHYFMLWQMIGVHFWHELFIAEPWGARLPSATVARSG